jgi:hypothetical protein
MGLLCAALCLVQVVPNYCSAQSATSAVVGFYSVSVPVGNSPWVCGLVTADLYQSEIQSVTADTDGRALVTFDNPGWTAGAFNLHYAEPLSGSAAGLAIDIVSNTVSTIKLNATPTEAGLSAGVVMVIRKHATLGSLFPNGAGFASLDDSVSLRDTAGKQNTYLWNGITSKWISGTINDANNVTVRPGQGMVIQVSAAKTIVLGNGEVCHVKTTPTRVKVIANNKINFVGPLNPTASDYTLGTLTLASAMTPLDDSLVILKPGSLKQDGTYLSYQGNFINGVGNNANSTVVPAGSSFILNVSSAKTVSLPATTVSP